jgi:putative toxin-antitoxin system antitoxin component (TIGR02293 family)
MGNMSLPEIYEELKDRRRQAAEIESLVRDLATIAHESGLDELADLIELARSEAERAARDEAGGHAAMSALIRELEIHALAQRVFDDAGKAKAWLSRPNVSLGGQSPSALLTDELGAVVVRETLEQIDHGIFA